MTLKSDLFSSKQAYDCIEHKSWTLPHIIIPLVEEPKRISVSKQTKFLSVCVLKKKGQGLGIKACENIQLLFWLAYVLANFFSCLSELNLRKVNLHIPNYL